MQAPAVFLYNISGEEIQEHRPFLSFSSVTSFIVRLGRHAVLISLFRLFARVILPTTIDFLSRFSHLCQIRRAYFAKSTLRRTEEPDTTTHSSLFNMAEQLNMGGLSLGDGQQPQRSYIPPHMRNRPSAPPAAAPMNGGAPNGAPNGLNNSSWAG